jgi:hypothetical protein
MSEADITPIEPARRKRRKQTGWALAEIEKRLQEERELYRQIAGGEPDCLASGGNMSKILEAADDDE